MSNRIHALLMLLLMLLMPLSIIEPNNQIEQSQIWPENLQIEYTKIESDPNSVRGLDNSVLSEGIESVRLNQADTRLGIFDEWGLRLDNQLPDNFATKIAII